MYRVVKILFYTYFVSSGCVGQARRLTAAIDCFIYVPQATCSRLTAPTVETSTAARRFTAKTSEFDYARLARGRTERRVGREPPPRRRYPAAMPGGAAKEP